jgi:hypothetical protein
MKVQSRQRLAFGSSVLFGTVMLLAASAKIEAFDSFLLFLRGLRHLPAPAIPFVGIIVPALELALGACCIIGSPPRHVHVAGAILLGGFVVLQILLAIPSLQLSTATCPCFGKLFPESGSGVAISRTSGVFALSVACLVLNPGRPSQSAPLPASIIP